MKLQELFKTTATDVQWARKLGYTEAKFITDSNDSVAVQFEDVSDNGTRIVDVEFFRDGKQSITGEGSAAKLLSMVYSIILDYLRQHPGTDYILFSANEPSRVKLYRAMVNRLAATAGFESVSINDVPGQEWSKHSDKIFALKNTQIDENWRKGLAAAGLGAAMALGGYGLSKLNQKTEPTSIEAAAQVDDENPTSSIEQKYTIPKSINHTSAYRTAIIKYATDLGIKGVELSQLLAQVGHETGGFKSTSEIGKKSYFNKYDVKHNPRLAKILGNIRPGDGYTYRGRGGLQVTGRYNYTKLNEFLKSFKNVIGDVDVVENPDLVSSNQKINALATLWYWQTRVKPNVSDFSNTKQVTKYINAGLKGLEDREIRFAHEQRTGLRVKDHEHTLYTSHIDDKPNVKINQPTPSKLPSPSSSIGKKSTPQTNANTNLASTKKIIPNKSKTNAAVATKPSQKSTPVKPSKQTVKNPQTKKK